MPKHVIISDGVGYRFQALTSTDVAQQLSSSLYKISGGQTAMAALITADTQNVRYRFDNTALLLTKTIGHLFTVPDSIFLRGAAAIQNFTIISAAAGVHGKVYVTFFFESIA